MPLFLAIAIFPSLMFRDRVMVSIEIQVRDRESLNGWKYCRI
ncbi:MAG TPA: hypothetical protein VK211_23055 [Kamptonema sp.]|nr:hypothetical protein [Kamptonema sp.]